MIQYDREDPNGAITDRSLENRRLAPNKWSAKRPQSQNLSWTSFSGSILPSEVSGRRGHFLQFRRIVRRRGHINRLQLTDQRTPRSVSPLSRFARVTKPLVVFHLCSSHLRPALAQHSSGDAFEGVRERSIIGRFQRGVRSRCGRVLRMAHTLD